MRAKKIVTIFDFLELVTDELAEVEERGRQLQQLQQMLGLHCFVYAQSNLDYPDLVYPEP